MIDTILIVDDDPTNIQVAAAHLRTLDVSISYALSAREARERIAHKPPSVILLDIMMPEEDGISFCRSLKDNREYRDIPVVFLTARVDKPTLVQAFEAGGVDYLTKPFHGPELIQRVHIQLRVVNLIRKLEETNADLNIQVLKAMEAQEALERSRDELIHANKKLQEMASRDSLTGLFNRRRTWELLEHESARSDRSGSPIGIVMLDIDFFKSINDEHGHSVGDEVLLRCAELLRQQVRKQDIVARWGGEEFLIVLPETGLEGSHRLGEKILGAARSTDWGVTGRSVTLSGGVAVRAPGQDPAEAIDLADELLYRAKQGGRNRISPMSEEN